MFPRLKSAILTGDPPSDPPPPPPPPDADRADEGLSGDKAASSNDLSAPALCVMIKEGERVSITLW